MRFAKAFLWFLCKAGIVCFGFVFSLVLAVAANDRPDRRSNLVFFAVFFVGLLTTSIALLAARRKSWGEVKYNTAAWVRRKAERELHPVRYRLRRVAILALAWVPCGIAAFVLLFFPAATHLVFPSSRHVGHYQIRVPLSFTALPASLWAYHQSPYEKSVLAEFSSSGRGRFGIAPYPVGPLWLDFLPLSEIYFSPNPRQPEFDAEWFKREFGSPIQIKRFPLGGVELTCYELRTTSLMYSDFHPEYSNVDCVTPPDAGPASLGVRFFGRQEDLGQFYEVVSAITPKR
jgi:hypothetical protein